MADYEELLADLDDAGITTFAQWTALDHLRSSETALTWQSLAQQAALSPDQASWALDALVDLQIAEKQDSIYSLADPLPETVQAVLTVFDADRTFRLYLAEHLQQQP